jgi:hypothetical protein
MRDAGHPKPGRATFAASGALLNGVRQNHAAAFIDRIIREPQDRRPDT